MQLEIYLFDFKKIQDFQSAEVLNFSTQYPHLSGQYNSVTIQPCGWFNKNTAHG